MMELLKTLLSPEQIQMLMDIAVAAGVVLASACKLIGAPSTCTCGSRWSCR